MCDVTHLMDALNVTHSLNALVVKPSMTCLMGHAVLEELPTVRELQTLMVNVLLVILGSGYQPIDEHVDLVKALLAQLIVMNVIYQDLTHVHDAELHTN